MCRNQAGQTYWYHEAGRSISTFPPTRSVLGIIQTSDVCLLLQVVSKDRNNSRLAKAHDIAGGISVP